MSIAERATYTVDEFLALPDSEQFELVDGYLVERHMGTLSSWVGGTVFVELALYAKQYGGWAFGDGVSYQCFPRFPKKVRRPDASYVRANRLEEIPEGAMLIAPDLAVEVISPNDTYYEVAAKVDEYLDAGVKLVWLINPQNRSLEIIDSQGTRQRLNANDELTGDDVLPGFRCAIRNLFPIQPDR